jgi:diguanylate cyclase (GGDEF)-like protein
MIHSIEWTLGGVLFVPSNSLHHAIDNLQDELSEPVGRGTADLVLHESVDTGFLQTDEQALRARVGKPATRSLDRSTALQEIAKAGIGIAGAECCGIYIWHRDTNQLEVGWEETVDSWPGNLLPGSRFPTAKWPTMLQSMETRNPFSLQVTNPRLSERERRRLLDEGAKSMLCVPMTVADECIGCCVLFSRELHDFTPNEMQLGRELAGHAGLAIHNSRLLLETKSRADEQAALLRVWQAAISSLDLSTVLTEIARATLGLAGAECCGIELLRPEADAVETVAEETIPEWPGVYDPGTRFPLTEWTATRRAIELRSPVLLDPGDHSLSDIEREHLVNDGVESQLIVPLLIGSDCLGALLLYSRQSKAFGQHALRLGREIAAVTALAIQNARLHDQARREAEERAALLRISEAMISGQPLPDVLKEVCRASLRIDGVEGCEVGLWRLEEDSVEVVAEQSVEDWQSASLSGSRIHLKKWPKGRQVVESRKPLAFLTDDPDLSDAERVGYEYHQVQSVLMLPLVSGGVCRGLLGLHSRQPIRFGVDAIRFSGELAKQSAIALENARLITEAERHAREQTALLKVSQAVISGQDLHTILGQVAKASLGVEGAEGCDIAVWIKDSNEYEIFAEQNVEGWNSVYLPGTRLALADWPTCAEVLETRKPRTFVVDDPEISAAERANYLADGTQSSMIVPLVLGQECLGLLSLHTRMRRRFSDHALRFGKDLAAQAAQAIDRARLFEAIQERADTDGLTGLLNHRAIHELLARDLAVARTTGTPLSLIMIDLDDFKIFNDTHGHQVGDRVLCEVASLLKSCVRGGDRVARYGGDEFLVELPRADNVVAHEVASRLIEKVQHTEITIDDQKLPMRLSVGVATFPENGRTRQKLISFADAAMYAAKDAGGGQVGVLHSAIQPVEPTSFGALSGLVRAVDRKDRYTKDHSDKVTDYAVRFGKQLGLPPDQIEALNVAGQLHDVGKIAVPDAVLRKPGRLTDGEVQMIRQHVMFSTLMVKGVPYLDDVLAAISHHHERWDGSGYPYAKAGIEIPLLGRIMALADAFAAMTHDRPYRKGRTLADAIEELTSGKGTQFDPDLVNPFIEMVASGTASLIAHRHRRKRDISTELEEPLSEAGD